MEHSSTETIPLRVLTYRDGDEWVCHLLEMDLVGTGETEEQAAEELKHAMGAQLAFCAQNGLDPYQPAPQELFDRWNQLQVELMSQAVRDISVPASDRHQRGGISICNFSAAYRDRNRSGEFVLSV